MNAREDECCGVSYGGGLLPPAICPNCGRPWGERNRPVEHRETGGSTHDLGYIAWCSCGIGSPPKATAQEAQASLAEHVATGEFPR